MPGEGKEGQASGESTGPGLRVVYLPRAYARPWSALLPWPHLLSSVTEGG